MVNSEEIDITDFIQQTAHDQESFIEAQQDPTVGPGEPEQTIIAPSETTEDETDQSNTTGAATKGPVLHDSRHESKTGLEESLEKMVRSIVGQHLEALSDTGIHPGRKYNSGQLGLFGITASVMRHASENNIISENRKGVSFEEVVLLLCANETDLRQAMSVPRQRKRIKKIVRQAVQSYVDNQVL